MTNTGKMTVGMLAGAIAGVTMGLLLAPEKGSVTRKRVLGAPRVWVNSLGQLFTRGNRRAKDELQRVRRRKTAAQKRVNELKKGIG